MSIQVKRRREAASFLSAFTGAQAELIVDTTNNRVQVHDGVTAGGWPAVKLAEAQTIGRTAVGDANYAILATDVLVAMTALTASRTLTLPASSTYPVGRVLRVLDESGAASASPQIVVAAQGSDTVDGGPSAVIQASYGSMELVSNGAGKWFKLQDVIATLSNLAQIGINTAADPNNPLSATLNAALLNALDTTYGGTGDVRIKLNKQTAANTASILYQDGFAGRAEIGLTGDDNFHFKVSSNGSSWSNGLLIDAGTGALTPGNARTGVADANYTALATDREIAFTALTAARTLTLPSAASFPIGVPLTIADESGACSVVNAIRVTRAGSDAVNSPSAGVQTTMMIGLPYGCLVLCSNGSNAWNVVGGSPQAPFTIRTETNPYPAGAGSMLIAGNVNSERVEIQSNIQPQFQGYYCGTSVDAPTAVQAGNVLFGLAGSGFNGSGRPGPFASSLITMAATENWSPTANGSAIAFITTPNGSPTGSHTERMRVDNTGYVGIGTTAPQCALDANGAIRTASYTVATLPAPSSAIAGARAYVTDAISPAFMGPLSGGGSTGCPVFCNGSAWLAG